MSHDKASQFEAPRSPNGTDTAFAKSPATEEERHDPRHDIDANSAQNARLTYWLKFGVGGLAGLLVALLYDRYVGIPRRPCPPCPPG